MTAFYLKCSLDHLWNAEMTVEYMQWILVLMWLLLTNSEQNVDYSIYVNNKVKKSSNRLPACAAFVFSFLSEAKWKNSPSTGQPEVSLGQLVYNYSWWLHHDDGRGHKPVAPSPCPIITTTTPPNLTLCGDITTLSWQLMVPGALLCQYVAPMWPSTVISSSTCAH